MSNDGRATTRSSLLLAREKAGIVGTGSALAGCYVIVPERLVRSELYSRLKRLAAKEGGILVVDRGNGTRCRSTRHLIEPD